MKLLPRIFVFLFHVNSVMSTHHETTMNHFSEEKEVEIGRNPSMTIQQQRLLSVQDQLARKLKKASSASGKGGKGSSLTSAKSAKTQSPTISPTTAAPTQEPTTAAPTTAAPSEYSSSSLNRFQTSLRSEINRV